VSFCAKQRKMRKISDSQRKTAQNRPNLDAQKQRKNRAQKCTMHIPGDKFIEILGQESLKLLMSFLADLPKRSFIHKRWQLTKCTQ
jgi:hypothetical protein